MTRRRLQNNEHSQMLFVQSSFRKSVTGFIRGNYQVMLMLYLSFSFLSSNLHFKVPLPDDDDLGPESEDNDEELQSVR